MPVMVSVALPLLVRVTLSGAEVLVTRVVGKAIAVPESVAVGTGTAGAAEMPVSEAICVEAAMLPALSVTTSVAV
jgi:hypothetical protein